MKPRYQIAGATVAVVGMAKSGFAAAALLREKGATVRALDSRTTDELKTEGARAGLKPETTGQPLPARAWVEPGTGRGEPNVRTLYGEGTARDLLRAI